MGVKYYHFNEGRTNGHPNIIIPMEEYCTIIGDNAWTYNPTVDINAYNPTAENEISVVRAVKEAEWKRKTTSLETFNSACAGAKYLIIYGVREDAVVTIKY